MSTAPRTALITTTIYEPRVLLAYLANARQYGHRLLLVVAGDRKTPPAAAALLQQAQQEEQQQEEETAHTIVYLSPSEQERFLASEARYAPLLAALPWNCIQRRNVALLYAYAASCDTIITIDDDNYPVENCDFVGGHLRNLGRDVRDADVPVVTAASGWYNICEPLVDHRGVVFYPRGYPMDERWKDTPRDFPEKDTPALPWSPERDGVREAAADRPLKVVVQAGLWLDDPDVDAITRLTNDIKAIRYRRTKDFALAPGTWSPFNSQNTALAREVIPAYFVSWTVGRHDDIWPSYVVRACADHLGHVVAYGEPLVEQRRNPHDYFVDHDKEKVGLKYVAAFCKRLRGVDFGDAASYAAAMDKVVVNLDAWATEGTGHADLDEFVRGFVDTMKIWQQVVPE